MHNRTLPRKNEKALMFVLTNCVMVHAFLGPNKKKDVLELAAMVLVYGHGYQKVKSIGRLARTLPSSLGRTNTR